MTPLANRNIDWRRSGLLGCATGSISVRLLNPDFLTLLAEYGNSEDQPEDPAHCSNGGNRDGKPVRQNRKRGIYNESQYPFLLFACMAAADPASFVSRLVMAARVSNIQETVLAKGRGPIRELLLPSATATTPPIPWCSPSDTHL